MIREWKVRGLVVLTAAPLLGVVPMATVAGADGSAPTPGEGRHDPLLKPPPRPRTHAKPKAKKDEPKPTKDEAKPKAKQDKPKATQAKPRPKGKQDKSKAKKDKPHAAHAKSRALHMGGPKREVLPGHVYEWTWTFRAPRRGSVKSGKAVFQTTLPKSLAFVSGEPDCAAQGRKVSCDLGTVRRGQKVRGTIKAKVDNRMRPGHPIKLRGTVTWGKAHVTRRFPAVRVAHSADLALTESAPSKARAGTRIPYVLRIRNLGPSTAEGVIVESSGPIKLVGRDAACMPRDRGYVCGVGSLRPGESRTLRLTAVPRGSVRAGTVLESSWKASSPTADSDAANNAAVLRTRITRRR
ncbi:hypothetical protein GCM10022254_49400 [Actinomadura meridiana]|uniref:DUF11 domain-containing protein n=1 Tax=Actinomadura meridiana TaxID=559626 RepID=A0ABP8CCB8_9ACTN